MQFGYVRESLAASVACSLKRVNYWKCLIPSVNVESARVLLEKGNIDAMNKPFLTLQVDPVTLHCNRFLRVVQLVFQHAAVFENDPFRGNVVRVADAQQPIKAL